MPSEDRDRLFEQALAAQVRRDAVDSGCLDAETLAAYHERLLSSEEMNSAKEHLVTCSRCQEILGQLEATQDVVDTQDDMQDQRNVATATAAQSVSPASRSAIPEEIDLTSPRSSTPAAAPGKIVQLAAKKSSTLRWVAPIGAIAAALLLWVGTREARLQGGKAAQSATEIAENRSVPRPNSEPAISNPAVADRLEHYDAPSQRPAASPLPPPPPPVALRDQPRASRNEESFKHQAVVSEPHPEKKAAEKNEARAPAEPVGGAAGNLSRGGLTGSEVQKSKELDANAADLSSVRTRADDLQDRQAQAKLPRTPSAAAPLSSTAAAPPALTLPANQSASSLEVSGKDGKASAALYSSNLNKVALLPASALSPDGKAMWRFGARGEIFYSRNAGKSWESQVSGVAVRLISGSAPSDKICWIAGAAGTLLRTTDGGKHWQSLPTPIASDLGGIRAVDANHASIWDASNRSSYQTADGGLTWQKLTTE